MKSTSVVRLCASSCSSRGLQDIALCGGMLPLTLGAWSFGYWDEIPSHVDEKPHPMKRKRPLPSLAGPGLHPGDILALWRWGPGRAGGHSQEWGRKRGRR